MIRSLLLLFLLSVPCFARDFIPAKEAKAITDKIVVKLHNEAKEKFRNYVLYRINEEITAGRYYCDIGIPEDLTISRSCLVELQKKGYRLQYKKIIRTLYVVWGDMDIPHAMKIDIIKNPLPSEN